MDKNKSNECCGCIDLLGKLDEVQPKFFIFGHIHESAGTGKRGDINLINACLLDNHYELVNEPVVFDFNPALQSKFLDNKNKHPDY